MRRSGGLPVHSLPVSTCLHGESHRESTESQYTNIAPALENFSCLNRALMLFWSHPLVLERLCVCYVQLWPGGKISFASRGGTCQEKRWRVTRVGGPRICGILGQVVSMYTHITIWGWLESDLLSRWSQYHPQDHLCFKNTLSALSSHPWTQKHQIQVS